MVGWIIKEIGCHSTLFKMSGNLPTMFQKVIVPGTHCLRNVRFRKKQDNPYQKADQKFDDIED